MTARSKKSTQPKDNAKGRRKKENTQLLDLAAQLPLPASVASQLDKASVIRLATAYLKLRQLFPDGLGKRWGEGFTSDGILEEMGKFLNKALHGFVFVLGSDGTILYISEEASAQLGYSQVQLTGKNFWSYVHSSDAKELKTTLCFEMEIPAFNVGSPVLEDIEVPKSFAVRMKCILPKRQAELAIDRYKVIHCRGYLKLKRKALLWDGPSDVCYQVIGVIAAGHSLSPNPSAELKLNRREFMFRTGLSLKFIYIEPGSQNITGYEPMYLQDKSLYRFIHPYDCKQMEQVHIMTVTKTQAVSSYYRFLTRCGGWIWMQSSCIVVANSKADRDQCILFVNNVLSEREFPDRLLDADQIPAATNNQPSSTKKNRAGQKNKRKAPHQLQKEPSSYSPKTPNLMNISQHRGNEVSKDAQTFGGDSSLIKPLNYGPGFIQHDSPKVSLGPQQIINSLPGSDKTVSLSFNECDTVLRMEEDFSDLPPLEPIIDATGIELEFASSKISHEGLHAVDSASHASRPDHSVESSHASAMHSNSFSKYEQLTSYSLPSNVNTSCLENGQLHSRIPESVNGADGHNDLSLCLPVNCWDGSSLRSTYDIHNYNVNANSKSDISIQDGNSFKIENSNKSAADCVVQTPASETDGLSQWPFPSTFADMKNCSFATCSGQLIANVTNKFTSDSYGQILCLNEPANQHSINIAEVFYGYAKNSCISETSGQIEESKSSLCNLSVPLKDSVNGSMVTSSNHELGFTSDLTNEVANASPTCSQDLHLQSGLPKNQFTRDDDIALTGYDRQSGRLLDLLLNINDSVEKSDLMTIPQDFHSRPAPEMPQTIDLSSIVQPVIENGYSNVFSIPQHLNSSLPRATDMATDSLTALSSDTSNNHRNEINACYEPSNRRTMNITRTTTNSVSEVTISTNNEHLTLLNDQWQTTHPQSISNARSDSASSVSLGYGSESSYLEQSSPFSAYGESSFF